MTEAQHRLAEDEQMPALGSIVGDRYEIKSVLGEGGFAAVYKAFDTRTKTDVAVKVLDPIMSRRSEFSARFLREVSTVSQLRHHNTIKIFDSGETDKKCLYLVMELLRGQPLDELVEDEEGGRLPPPRVKYIVQQILKSLYEAHELGIIHRDLKPANVFIADLAGEKDYVKVLDFGIAKSIDESQDSSLTATGQVMCSPDYVAPERVRDHVAYPASDLYSLGIMMIEMLDGELPYQGDSPMMVALQHVKIDEPVPMRESTANGPLGWVIRKACSKDLSQRYTTAAEMLEDLASVTFDGINTRSAEPIPPRGGASANQMTQQAAPIGGSATVAMDRENAPGALDSGEYAFEPSSSSKAIPLIIAALVLILAGGLVAFFLTRPGEVVDENVTTTAATTGAQSGVEVAAGAEGTPAESDETPVVPEVEKVTVSAEPAGAVIFLNDRELGPSPQKVDAAEVQQFPVRIRAELAGYESKTQTINSREALLAGIGVIRLEEIPEETTTATAATGTDQAGREDDQGASQRARDEQRRREAAASARREEAAAAASQLEQEEAAAAAAARREQVQAAETPEEPSGDSSAPSRIIDLRPRR